MIPGAEAESIKDTVEKNLGLVGSVVRRFFMASGEEYEDLFQIGSIGLIKAAERFDPDFGVCFSTYAVPLIAGEIKRYLRDSGSVKISRSIKKIASDAYKISETIKKNEGESPPVSRIAKEMGRDEEEIIMALDAVRPMEYLNDNSGEKSAFSERISLQNEGDIIEKIALRSLLERLEEREKNVIVLRYFKDLTQAKTARVLGISQVQVSRIEAKAVKKLRRHFDE